MKELDLHGVRYLDVDRLISTAVVNGTFPLIVITGNSARMKELVRQIASRFHLSTRQSISNTGRLVIEE